MYNDPLNPPQNPTFNSESLSAGRLTFEAGRVSSDTTWSQDFIPGIIDFIKSFYPESNQIPLHCPRFTGNEKKYIIDAIDSSFVSSVGKYVDRLEDMICDITGANFAIGVVNGTCALHLALVLAGVEEGDEVITQPLSFVATANAISYCGATPVFLDIDQDTLGLDPTALDYFLQSSTRIKNKACYNLASNRRITACVPMHTFGHPCRIDALADICDRYHITLVEDAAESLGSTYKGKHAGTFGEFGIYSLNGNKIVTCGGGGVIVTNNEGLSKKAKHLSTTAKVSHPYEYVHDVIGYNYRMPNLNAALACAQLEQLDSFIENKRELAKAYEGFFRSIGITFFKEPVHARSNYWLNALILPDRKARRIFLETTNKAKVMTRPSWKLLNQMNIYRECQTDSLINARWFEDRLVNLPSSVRI